MPDPIARKRLKEKMLQRWENEGGSIASDTKTSDDTGPTSGDRGHGKKLPSPSDNSTTGTPESPRKRRKPTRK